MFPQTHLKALQNVRKLYQEQNRHLNQKLPRTLSEEEAEYENLLINFKRQILQIEISGIQYIPDSADQSSYFVYIIKVITENFSYFLKRRFSEFETLYTHIKTKATHSFHYQFPNKKFSHSFENLIKIKATQEKTALNRKIPLHNFLNQIKINYEKDPKIFILEAIQLLKFIKIKSQLEKRQYLKEGRIINLLDKCTLDPNQSKNKDVGNYLSVEVLSDLLDHQLLKINLGIVQMKQKYEQADKSTDIIKTVRQILQIVLELNKRITKSQVKNILFGSNWVQTNFPNKQYGLVEIALSVLENQLISNHILDIFVNFIFNPEVSYTADLFTTILLQVPEKLLRLNSFNQISILRNQIGQFRSRYFSFINIYFQNKLLKEYLSEQEYLQKKNNILGRIMSPSIKKSYQQQEDNKLTIKKWKYNKLNSIQIIKEKGEFEEMNSSSNSQNQKQIEEQEKEKEEELNLKSISKKLKNLKEIKRKNSENFDMFLKTSQQPEFSYYLFSCQLKNYYLEDKIQNIFQNQINWNPLLESQVEDRFTNTKKQIFKFPNKQQKVFRFIEHIDMKIQWGEEEEQIEMINFVDLEENKDTKKKNPKASVQTMYSQKGSIAQNYKPSEQNSVNLRKQCIIKKPVSQKIGNSFHQKVSIKRREIIIEMLLNQVGAIKYLSSQINGTTAFIWDKILSLLQ